jgi:hypothetical protein
MRVLVACEESQAVCKAFRALGHEAFSCDIVPCSGGHPEWHIQDDVLNHLNDGWDLMVAHPPCTYLSNAGARWLHQGGELNISRYQKGLDGKRFFMALYNAPIEKIAVENPMPEKLWGLPAPSAYIEPYYFGHDLSKKTYLWLKNLPPLMPTEMRIPSSTFCPSSSIRKGDKRFHTFANGTKERSKTFPGIAAAMADQWGNTSPQRTTPTGGKEKA